MNHSKYARLSRFSLLRLFAVALAAAVSVAACTTSQVPRDEPTATTSEAVFVNGGFETGTAGMAPPSWPVTLFLNPGITVQTPQTLAGLNLQTAIAGHAAPVPLTVIMASAGGPLSQPDAFLGAGASLRWPRYGNQCALVNQGGRNQNVNSMSQTMTVSAGDVDPSDGQVHIRFVVAPVLENPGHPANEQPYFFVQATNVTQGNKILYANFNFSNQAGVPWKTVVGGGTTYVYTDWQLVDISPGSPAINMGDSVTLQVIAAGCSLGGHMGQLYIDGVGPSVPGLFVSGTGPAQANACSNISYKLAYQNGAATPAIGVQVEFNTPPNTTFQSINAPGLTCTTPAVGAAGLVTCTIGNLAAGAGGSFTITVNIPCGTTGTITAGNYFIQGTGIEALLGPVINTIIGCTQDSECSAGNWCDESANVCTATLPNGTLVPSDPPHTNPTLNGTCIAGVGALVCTSGVCDMADNECGYANGDGPCTMANGGVVCRSGACSTNGTCEPAGGCNVDADCAGGNWCDESTHTCTPKLPNGTLVPSDPPHTNPTLNGVCTAPAAALVCVSAVCDRADNECGYANGDGPCTVGNGGVVCRSGSCSANAGVCIPVGGCAVDADCTSGQYCNTPTLTCVPKVPNGSPVPTVPGHSPVLAGTCTAAAGAVACVSGVCDTSDNDCGYANGDGPCTMGNGGTVCRSGMCSTNNTCEPAGGCNVDADCSGGMWCNESVHTCTPQVANGGPVPTDPPHMNPTLDGTCTPQAGTLVCVSGVCDTADNECGYANGDGPCTMGNGGTVCRSGMCSTGGTCEPAGGCNVDADCAAGQWCDESAHMCQAQLANGTLIPTDPPHMNPTLNGMCSAQAGTLVCSSGVCDTADNECGYANGDGPCTMGNGGTVCRSGACSTNGTCEPAGGCNVDGDCTNPGMPDCNPVTHTCVAGPDAGSDAGRPDGGDGGTAGDGGDGGMGSDASEAGPPIDSGSVSDAASDASVEGDASDAASTSDATEMDSTMADGAHEEDAGDQSGFVEGGGLSCSMGRAPRGPSSLLIAAVAVGLGLGARRRRRGTDRD